MPDGLSTSIYTRDVNQAFAAIDFYTEWKTLYIDCSDKLRRAQIDNN